MKTAQETAHIRDGFTHLKPTFDGSERDLFQQGLLQALQDFTLENRRIDIFDLTSKFPRSYHEGYDAGWSVAQARWSALQPKRKGFPDTKGFDARAHYGRSH